MHRLTGMGTLRQSSFKRPPPFRGNNPAAGNSRWNQRFSCGNPLRHHANRVAGVGQTCAGIVLQSIMVSSISAPSFNATAA